MKSEGRLGLKTPGRFFVLIFMFFYGYCKIKKLKNISSF